MVFAILGTVNRDRIVTEDGVASRSLGGVLYNVLTLARCLGGGHSIRPVARLGEEDRGETMSLLARLPSVDPSGLVFVPGASNEATLRYTGPDSRSETLVERVGSLSDEEVRSCGDADFLLANLISGWDFTHAQLAGAVRGRGARALLDIQSLTLAPPGPDGLRAPRAVPDWEAWCAPLEIVKGNEAEVGLFVGRALERPEDLARAGERVLGAGPRVLVVTLGPRGVCVATREAGRARPRVRLVPAVAGVAAADTTGCGDGFASGFLAEYAESGDPLRAACAGNAVAALVAARRGLRSLLDMPDPRPLADRLLAGGAIES